jgi:hypothetical protein
MFFVELGPGLRRDDGRVVTTTTLCRVRGAVNPVSRIAGERPQWPRVSKARTDALNVADPS